MATSPPHTPPRPSQGRVAGLRPRLTPTDLLGAVRDQRGFAAQVRALAGFLNDALRPVCLRLLAQGQHLRHEERLGRREVLQPLEDALQGALNRKLRRGEVFENENYSLPTGRGRRTLSVYAFPVGQNQEKENLLLLATPRPLRAKTKTDLKHLLDLCAYLLPLWETSQLGHALAREQEQLQDRQVAFATNVSHELRTPLTNLSGFLKTLKKKADATTGELLEIALGEAGKLERLVEGFQDFLRAEQGETPPSLEAFDAASALHGLVAVHQRFAPAGRPLSAALPHEEVWVSFDLDLLQGVFGELLENARKYGAGATVVTLTHGHPAGVARFTVQDTGPGVPDKDLPSLFDRFFKVHRPDAYNAGGAGLGLYVARRRARAAGGDLCAENLPGGFAVSLTMPLAGAPPGATEGE